MKLAGKNVIVTGAGSGVGEAIAAEFAREGARVVTVGRTADKLEKARLTAGDAAERIFPFAADVSSREGVNAVMAFAHEKLGQIDILVNNAGTNVPKRKLTELSPEDFEYMVNVNLNGAFYFIHAVLPEMRDRKDGIILNVSSIAGVRPTVLAGTGYNASKHGMAALSLSVHLEEGKNGIRCCLICPGEINTPILLNRPVMPSDEAKAKMLQPEDLAAAAMLCATLDPRATIPELIITPTIQDFA
ncbi:MAG: SDR family NAD(P)-dependent oxidoreductase [Acidobacteria bacterium]|nr:SDR family NAD(P)-dependent oxidoreductase [Acidobacteriota bacterium]